MSFAPRSAPGRTAAVWSLSIVSALWIGAALAPAVALAADEAGDDTELFDRLDANSDGQIVADEVDADKKRLFERLLRTSDGDDDGRLSREEFTAGTQSKRPPRPIEELQSARIPGSEQVDKLIREMDVDGNGRITADEVPEKHKRTFGRLIEAIDYSKDGVLDRRELTQGAQQLRRVLVASEGGRGAEMFFQRIDRDQDGKVVLDEVPEERRENFERLLDRGDRDGDGALSRVEFMRTVGAMFNRGTTDGAMAKRDGAKGDGAKRDGAKGEMPAGGARPATTRFRPPLFSALDSDRDGELSADEIAAASSSLATLDADRDGRLSPRELFAPPTRRDAPASGASPSERRPSSEQRRPSDRPRRPEAADASSDDRKGDPDDASKDERKFGPDQLVDRLLGLDRNGDGKLDKDEAPPKMAEYFLEIDENGDGGLDRQELRRPAGQILEKMREGGPEQTRRRLEQFGRNLRQLRSRRSDAEPKP